MVDSRVALLLLAAAAGDDDAPARRLPPVITVCRAADRCWTEPGESRCPTGEVFRIVIDGPGRTDGATALDDCRKPSDAHRSQ